MLNKSKYSRSIVSVNPFGSMFMARVDLVNNKLVCSLSRAGCDTITRDLGECGNQRAFGEIENASE